MNMQRYRQAGIALTTLLLATSTGPVNATDDGPTPVLLPPLEGNPSSEAIAINNPGEIAGFSFDGTPTATVWNRHGTPTPRDPLDGDSGSKAFAINDRGVVAGDSIGTITSAVRWGRYGAATRLAPPEGDLESFARGINNRGEVAGYSSNRNDEESNGLLFQAVRWDIDGNPIVLSPLAGDTEAIALAINAHGQVVGYSFSPGGLDTAVVWNRSGNSTALLPLPGEIHSEAADINLRGRVAGDSEDGAEVAIIWNSPDEQIALLPLASDLAGQAFAINLVGATVGVSISEELIHTAVLWPPNGSPISLPALPGDDETWAEDINWRGDMVGFSTGDDGTTAVLWPAPSYLRIEVDPVFRERSRCSTSNAPVPRAAADCEIVK